MKTAAKRIESLANELGDVQDRLIAMTDAVSQIPETLEPLASARDKIDEALVALEDARQMAEANCNRADRVPA